MRVAVNCDESDVLIEVANRGAALSETTLKHIFEPLIRGSNPADKSGLGLGLYIVSKIAEAHGGVVEARSNDTETVFAVRLPRDVPTLRSSG